MEPTIPTPPASSTVTGSSIVSLQVLPFHLLEISVISAQDLAPVSKSMRTYAVTWVHPSRKLSTRVDTRGHTNPTWNDRFAFRVDDELLSSDSAAVTIEIYTVSWFRNILVGTVRVLLSNLLVPSASAHSSTKRFVALQIRRPSGTPQGRLHMGVSLLDNTMRSMPLGPALGYKQNILEKNDDQEEVQINEKIQLWRSLSVTTDLVNEDFPLKPGSICNGSAINGSVVNESELCSDVGPSASIVAAEIAAKGRNLRPPPAPKGLRETIEGDETGNSIVEDLTPEEAKAKGLTSNIERWKKELPPKHDSKGSKCERVIRSNSSGSCGGHLRRHSDGGGLFSCFGNAYGFEFTIVCGARNKPDKKNKSSTSRSNSKYNRSKRSGDQNSI